MLIMGGAPVNQALSVEQYPLPKPEAPALFQKMMVRVLQGIPGVICYIDDILVSKKDDNSHLRTLEEVFRHLEKHGFRLKQKNF